MQPQFLSVSDAHLQTTVPTVSSCLTPAASFICATVLDCITTGDPCPRVWLWAGRPLPTAVSSISPLCCGGSLGPATPVNWAMKGVFAQAPTPAATALLSWGTLLAKRSRFQPGFSLHLQTEEPEGSPVPQSWPVPRAAIICPFRGTDSNLSSLAFWKFNNGKWRQSDSGSDPKGLFPKGGAQILLRMWEF